MSFFTVLICSFLKKNIFYFRKTYKNKFYFSTFYPLIQLLFITSENSLAKEYFSNFVVLAPNLRNIIIFKIFNDIPVWEKQRFFSKMIVKIKYPTHEFPITITISIWLLYSDVRKEIKDICMHRYFFWFLINFLKVNTKKYIHRVINNFPGRLTQIILL